MTQAAVRRRRRALGSGAAELAHGLNNLLSIIDAAVEAALARPSTDAETRCDLALIKGSARDGAAVLRRLLTGEALGHGNLRLVAIDPLIADFAATLRRVCGPRIRVELALGLSGGAVLVDAEALRHALLNLTVNARDAMPEGGVLEIATGAATLRDALPAIPQAIPPGRYALIALRDSGSGVAPALLERVFTAFFTTKSARAGAAGGSGIGLYSVRETARRHGGFVAIASAPGSGTVVRLYLPLRDGPGRLGGGRRVLLIENEPVLRRFLQRLLDRHGWRVTVVGDAQSALRVLSPDRTDAEAADILITDIGLPDMEGLALLRAARRLRPGLSAIVVSGYAEVGELAALERVAYLRKPFDAAELLDLLAGLAASRPPNEG